MIPGSASPLLLKSAAAAAGGYQIERSLRFNSSDSGFCSRTPGTAGNRRTWTWAGWVKRSAISFSAEQHIWGVTGTTDNTYGEMYFGTGDTLRFAVGYNNAYGITTTRVFRDPGAWFHLVLAFDATQATAANKIRLYVNGVEETAFSSDTRSSLANQDWGYNNNVAHYIGRNPNSNIRQFNGYLADIHFIDGQALTPSSFTEVSATTGQLIPKAYSGSFGTNGFWLKFSDNSALTSGSNVGVGKDYSGNANYFNTSGLSVTAGAGNDSLVDTPTSYGTDTSGVGGSVRGNYATLNPLFVNAMAATLSNGNLDYTASSGYAARFASIGMSSGKWYAEFTFSVVSGGQLIGIANNPPSSITFVGDSASGYSYAQGGQKYTNGSDAAYGAPYTNGNIIGIAFDADAGTLVFYNNGSSQGTAFSSIAAGSYFFGISGSSGTTGSWNFGQRPFAYQTPGTNRPAATFLALCDTNLGAPLVAKPNTLMDVIAYSGSGASRTFTDLTYSPDLVWIKQRSGANNHRLYDVVRGATKALYSNLTNSEGTDSSGLTAFTSNGFTLGDGDVVWNASGQTYAAWCWDAGTSTVSNTSGSITSQVRANVSAGFSVVTYTGPGPSNNTVGHGLGVAPELIITKNRDRSIYWIVYTKATGKDAFLRLNTTDASAASNNIWGTAAPTSTVFGGVGTDLSNGYTAGEKIVSYCFAPVVGYSSFGSYTGNGSADGPFIFTSFRPRWILYKRSDAGTGNGNWNLVDTSRSTYNVSQTEVIANDSIAEFTSSNANMDILSNGFKIRTTDTSRNESAKTFIYFAVAENPFAYARAR